MCDSSPMLWQVFALVLMAMSVSAAVLSSLYLKPYTLEAPKKVFLQHLHTQVSHVPVSLSIFKPHMQYSTSIGVGKFYPSMTLEIRTIA